MARIVYTPHSGMDPRALSHEGIEVWAPTLVGRNILVSNLGRMYSEARGEWEVTPNRTTGYRQVYTPGYGKAYVHWLVLASFEGIQSDRRVVRTNKDRADNRLFNLSWAQEPT